MTLYRTHKPELTKAAIDFGVGMAWMESRKNAYKCSAINYQGVENKIGDVGCGFKGDIICEQKD